jgi:hypothetical protein
MRSSVADNLLGGALLGDINSHMRQVQESIASGTQVRQGMAS